MKHSSEIRLAMLGMIEGNGHPYSWSAIINGYRPELMAACPYPAIATYLGKQTLESVRIPGARVTHIWTDDPEDAPKVAAASRIENVVQRPEDVIGKVDAVVLATDDGADHVRRAAPFIKAGLPMFVDKPLAINIPELRQFVRWKNEARAILSSSGMRYAPEMAAVKERCAEIGEQRWITSITSKTWERYGIHALEPLYVELGPGFLSAETVFQPGSDIVHLKHRTGIQVSVAAIHDAYGSFGNIHVYGTKGQMTVTFKDTYTAFRNQLLSFISWLETGRDPFPFEETIELMCILSAGIRSREQKRLVTVEEIRAEVNQANA